jgi:iron complex outermembrane recepter protein
MGADPAGVHQADHKIMVCPRCRSYNTCLRYLFLLFPTLLLAQNARHESIVVTGTAEPVALEEADRSLTLLPVPPNLLLANTIVDFLRLDPSLDLQERGPNGMQADISIRGAGYGQTLILLNGQRLNDVQSGHHNTDLPVPIDSVDRVEILRGAGSTLYGSDAIGGVINIITRPQEATEFRLRSALGNFGVNQERGVLSTLYRGVSEQIVFSRDFSSGFRPNRDYRNLSLASTTYFSSPLGKSNVTLGYADKPFGADQFYGPYPSWEDTKTWYAGLEQNIGARTQVDLSFRRHSDLFVLFRYQPQIYTNHHEDETWQASIRRTERLSANANLHYGFEGFHDSIISNNLGNHVRSRGAVYAEADFRALRRFSLTLGAREEMYRKFSGQFSPSVAGGVWLSPRWKLRGGASRAFRVPTYTDLYYSDPANLGNPYLKPETAWNYEGGLDWNRSSRLKASATVFHRRETNGIDYIRASTLERWQPVNFERLRFTGIETSLALQPIASQRIDIAYTGLYGAQAALNGLFSKYVFNYPSASAILSWRAAAGDLLFRTRLGILNRRAREPYALWDIYMGWNARRLRPFLQLGNVTGTQYQEIAGIPMPGRTILGGIELVVFK